jgi:ribosomal protein S18 acetylase RimI-like enzyme
MRVRPLTREDLPQVGDITHRTFKDDELYTWLYPNQDKFPDDIRRFQMLRLRLRLVGLGQLGFVVVTEEGDSNWKGKSEVVGYAFMVRCGNDEGAKRWKTDSLSRSMCSLLAMIGSVLTTSELERKLLDWEMWYERKFLDRAADAARIKKFMELAPWDFFKKLNPRWHLSIIAVSPQHQRRGVGSMLVECGQKIAAEEGIPLTLESSVVGRKLYAKKGFKVAGGYEIYDGFTDMMMAWEPKEQRGKWLEYVGDDGAKIKVVK